MNWIFAGTGQMAQQMLISLRDFPDEKLVAAVSRRSEPLVRFCAEHHIPHHYTHPAEITREKIKSLNLDAIYICTPHSSHDEWIEWGLKNHLHVLVEKPACLNSARWKELSALAHQKNRCLMEARWTLFFPAIQFLRNDFQEGNLGKLQQIESRFCIEKEFDSEHRLWNPSLGGGALWDLGIYSITLLQLFFSKKEIELLNVEKKISKTGVEQFTRVTHQLPNEGKSLFECAFDRFHPQEAHLDFTLTKLHLNDFFHPSEIQWQTGLVKKNQTFEALQPGYQHELSAFIEGCQNKEVEVGLCNHQWTLEAIELIEEILDFPT